MEDGTKVALDVLVYATGFDPHAYMRPMNVTGLNGVTIDEAWQERTIPTAASRCPAFPNLFMLYGPFSPVNNVPVPLGLEQEIGCIMRLVGEARRRRAAVAPTVDCDRAVRCAPRRGVPRHGLGRRLQELVYQPPADTGAMAVPADASTRRFSRGAGRGFRVRPDRPGRSERR